MYIMRKLKCFFFFFLDAFKPIEVDLKTKLGTFNKALSTGGASNLAKYNFVF